ncbi:MAG: type II toxin-antitoxin system RelE/ParE family toxin [Flavobacteriales bacterium]|nr:type II toxin-antitoxin system RelE/ParE family toxin [Flavobacteriales bacterium]
MSYTLVVKPEAIAETAEIYAYHKQIGQALADRFDKELDACYAFITRNPTGYQIRKKNYRHVMVRKFRYRVVYALIGQDVVVFQVRHTSRKVSEELGP